MKDRRRQHDDIHYPLDGKGKRTTRPKRREAQRCLHTWVSNRVDLAGTFCVACGIKMGADREMAVQVPRPAQ